MIRIELREDRKQLGVDVIIRTHHVQPDRQTAHRHQQHAQQDFCSNFHECIPICNFIKLLRRLTVKGYNVRLGWLGPT